MCYPLFALLCVLVLVRCFAFLFFLSLALVVVFFCLFACFLLFVAHPTYLFATIAMRRPTVCRITSQGTVWRYRIGNPCAASRCNRKPVYGLAMYNRRPKYGLAMYNRQPESGNDDFENQPNKKNTISKFCLRSDLRVF